MQPCFSAGELKLCKKMKYYFYKTCDECNNDDSYEINKFEAAFETYDFDVPCSKCGSKKYSSIGHQRPELDKELLDIWGSNTELHFMQQDEELLLAELENLPMILKAIDESKYHKRKIDVLIEAICVILYNNTFSPEEFSEKENLERKTIADQVRPELMKRKKRISEASDVIMPYIKEVVFPQIGLKTKK